MVAAENRKMPEFQTFSPEASSRSAAAWFGFR
jgi:hypothetical protein